MSKIADKLIAEIISEYFNSRLKDIERMVASAVAKILKAKTSEYRRLVEELAKPGKDADEQKVIDSVISRLVLPDEKRILGELLKKIPPPLHGSSDMGEEIVDKINALPVDDPDKKIAVEHIKNIKEFIERLFPNIGSGSLGVALRGGMEQVDTERLAPTLSGANITLDLTGLTRSWNRVVFITRNGQVLEPETTSGWTRSGNTVTVYNATTDESFLVNYVHG